jgi:hypothetical protein
MASASARRNSALAQAISPIGDHQISCLQVKDFQVFALLLIGHLELGQATRQQIKGRMHPPDHPLGSWALQMGAIDQQNAAPSSPYQPGRDRCGNRQHFLQQPAQPGAGSLQAFAPVVGGNICYAHQHTPDAQVLKGMHRVHIGQQSSQQIRGGADLSTTLKGFELHGLILHLIWQAGHYFPGPIVGGAGNCLRTFAHRRIMGPVWHVASPGTHVANFFDYTMRRLATCFFSSFFPTVLCLSSRLWGWPPGRSRAERRRQGLPCYP